MSSLCAAVCYGLPEDQHRCVINPPTSPVSSGDSEIPALLYYGHCYGTCAGFFPCSNALHGFPPTFPPVDLSCLNSSVDAPPPDCTPKGDLIDLSHCGDLFEPLDPFYFNSDWSHLGQTSDGLVPTPSSPMSPFNVSEFIQDYIDDFLGECVAPTLLVESSVSFWVISKSDGDIPTTVIEKEKKPHKPRSQKEKKTYKPRSQKVKKPNTPRMESYRFSSRNKNAGNKPTMAALHRETYALMVLQDQAKAKAKA